MARRGKRSTASSIRPLSGLGSFGKNGEGTLLVPFPLVARPDSEQNGGAMVGKVLSTSCFGGASEVQKEAGKEGKRGEKEREWLQARVWRWGGAARSEERRVGKECRL